MIIRSQSLAVMQLKILYNDEELYSATGFTYHFGKNYYLVSNWHVFSAINPLTQESRPNTLAAPNRVEFYINVHGENGTVQNTRLTASLRDAENREMWMAHKGYRTELGDLKIVDIAVLPIEHLLEQAGIDKNKVEALNAKLLVNIDEDGNASSVEEGFTRVGSDVFILGFPGGLTKQGFLPIWKKGSVASEPLFGILDGAPAFLVDGLTREGMSGAPVLQMSGEIVDSRGVPSSLAGAKDPWVLGVYAGREGVLPDEVSMTLGRVWHRRLIDEIIKDHLEGLSNTAVSPHEC